MSSMVEPDDFEDGYEMYDDDFCDHEDYDADILTGRAHCYRCGEAWWMTDDQLRRHIELSAQSYECLAALEDK